MAKPKQSAALGFIFITIFIELEQGRIAPIVVIETGRIRHCASTKLHELLCVPLHHRDLKANWTETQRLITKLCS